MTKKQRKEQKRGLRSQVALAALRVGAGPMGDRRTKRTNRRSWMKEVDDRSTG